MKGKEIYVLIVDDVYKYESNVSSLVFSSIDDGRTELQALKDNAVKENSDYILDEWEDRFSCYKEYDYSVNHYDARIEKQTIL